MSSYTITVRSEAGAETIVTVDDGGGGGPPRVTEVVVRAPEGTGLTAEQVPFLRLDLLLQALSSPPPPVLLPTARGRPGGADQLVGSTRRRSSPAGGGPHAGPGPDTVGSGPGTSPSRPVGGARTYRRMPTDLAEVYQRLGGVTAVAEHYDVPRHTAQGWIGRLRHKARQD